ncbi:hypothetical protein LSH36_149g00006 [Paralvinella palmiformis]|uniref:EGF-like domain-containing protein n=1 Tax=Paralvinella palmiformis TaxID=53620 RepID=A0AAD9JUZ5_9ANNE|nr:hypothetical protein LSH36_149g00006 [Paralvinella palmiformis]
MGHLEVTLLLLVLMVTSCFSNHESTHHRERRTAEFSCEDTETIVKSPLEFESGLLCKDVIGRPPDRYKAIYLETCQRWLGLTDLPDSVANTYVDQCQEYSTTTAQRCFTCSKATNTYECTHGGKVVSCPSGQVCMTQSLNYRHNGYSRGYRFAQCARRSKLYCKNGGLLTYDKTMCYCPISKTGKECEINTSICGASANYVCMNGGTCYNHTSFGSGLRCLCTPGWIGTHCEQGNNSSQLDFSSLTNIDNIATQDRLKRSTKPSNLV